MKLGPKYKICKRLGAGIFEKCQTQKFSLSEARNPKVKRSGGMRGGSNFGVQLLEKQKARYSYGVTEKQFFNYVKDAMATKGSDSSKGLISRLESRLDNVAYRAGFAATRRQARQLASHGHITVNGRRVTVPSYQVSKGDVIAVRTESRTSPIFGKLTDETVTRVVPAWLSPSADPYSITIGETPTVISTELMFDPAVIIQFYSR